MGNYEETVFKSKRFDQLYKNFKPLKRHDILPNTKFYSKENATEDAQKAISLNQYFGIVYNPKFENTGDHADDSNPRILNSVIFTSKDVKVN